MRRNLLAVVAAVLAGGSVCSAAIHSAQLPAADYGHVDQNTAGIGFGSEACGPASVVNSFDFLANTYGLTGLIHTDEITTVNDLEEYMVTGVNGTEISNFINGKMTYIADRGLSNRISVEGESIYNLGIEGVTDNTKPTWDYILDQIVAGQDVEVLGGWWDPVKEKYVGGHYLTVNGITWDDTANTGTLTFVDPWGGQDITGNLSLHNGYLQNTYSGGAASNPNDPDNPDVESSMDISAVVAESPVPEPATASLLILGALLTGLPRRSRRIN